MNCRVQTQEGMGNLITRTWKASLYQVWKTTNPTDAQVLEPFVAGLAAEAIYLGFVSDVIARVPDSEFRDQLIERMNAASAKLQEIDRAVRQAAADAYDDGHGITIRDNDVGLGVAPLIIVAVVAVGAVFIVCQYLSYAATVSNIRTYLTHKEAMNAAIRLNRPDLIGQVVNNSGQNNGNGAGDQIGKAVAAILTLGAVGAGIWFLTQRRRR